MFPVYEEVLARLDKGQLSSFPGGVHPGGHKGLSNQTQIGDLPLAKEYVVPVRQHIGTEGTLLVRPGDKVLKGQPLTQSSQPFSVPVHAPASGTIAGIAQHVTAHPSGLDELCVTLKADGHDTWYPLSPCPDYAKVEKVSLTEKLCDAGISGMGGAGFPSHIKVTTNKPVEFLIINGVECEPYITSDDRLMREHADGIMAGIEILVHLLSPKCVVIAIEDNKPEAIRVLSKQVETLPHIRVATVETKYPAGGEKQLIQVVTGREVPRKGLPLDVGVTMFNVGTCFAVAQAIIEGKPLVERIVTVTGQAVKRPGNYRVRLGTPVNHVLSQAGYLGEKQTTPQVIMGGPMMGFTLNDAAVPVVKTTNCLLVPATGELTNGDDERACIRCSACADACPATLLPQQLYWHSKAKEYDKAQEYNLFDCIECGACAYVCPSEIPLVHYYRKAKADIRLELDEKAKADKAKERFEARKARLEREKEEREAKHRKAKEARLAAAAQPATDAPASQSSDTAPKDKVAAALARAKARKAAAQKAEAQPETAPAPQEEAPAANDKKAAVAAAIARAKAKKAAQNATPPADSADAAPAPEGETDNKKAAVAAAIARAKAKKAAQNATPPADSADAAPAPEGETDNKKAAVAAAIARAKAKKAAREAQQSADDNSEKPPVQTEPAQPEPAQKEPEATQSSPAAPSAEEARKARIAAAVAKAKAKKAAKDNDGAPEQAAKTGTGAQETTDKPDAGKQTDAQADSDTVQKKADPADEKKARIAAAVAKAKAKKAARDNGNND